MHGGMSMVVTSHVGRAMDMANVYSAHTDVYSVYFQPILHQLYFVMSCYCVGQSACYSRQHFVNAASHFMSQMLWATAHDPHSVAPCRSGTGARSTPTGTKS